MDAIETLSNEHGLIRQYLDNLAMAIERIEQGQRPPREFFDKAAEFARAFADKFHHFKEEHILFTLLAQKHSGEIDAQLETLRHQHERGRSLVAAWARAIDGYAAGDPQKTDELLESLAAHIALLRRHIHIEDHVFYPLAKKTLSEEEFKALAEEFEKERKRQGERTFEQCHKLVVDMGSLLVHM